MSKISIKLKITIWYTVILLIISSAALTVTTAFTWDMLTGDVKAAVQTRVKEFAKKMEIRDGQLYISPGAHFRDRGVYTMIFDSNDVLLKGEMPEEIKGYKHEYSDSRLRKNTYGNHICYEYDMQVTLSDQSPYRIKGIKFIDDKICVVMTALRNNIILTLILIFAAGAGGYFIIYRALIPVNKIRKTAKEISDSEDLSGRISLSGGKDEIHALANTFDEMLEKLEEAFNREKQFTADASHELRTPVSVILSECEYAKECARTIDAYSESIAVINRQALKMQKLISELLFLARADKHTLKANFEETDLSELLTFVCDELENIHSGNIALKRNIEPEISALADKSLMARLFINVISNAYQYNSENGVIEVALSKAADKIIFSVKDSGIGISEENIPKIWERFYQVEKSRTCDDNISMGLGLSMVKQITLLHCGRVSVNSRLGYGSEFMFEFGDVKKSGQ